MTKGDRIKKLREEKNLTQEEMAKLLSTTKQTISKYEKGIVTNIPSDKLEKMSKVLGTTPEYILGWDENNEETIQKIDVTTDILIRMEKDKDFSELVQMLYALDSEKISAVKTMLNSFS